MLALAVLVSPPATRRRGRPTPLTVGQAIGQQTGTSQTVRGYVVGQPTATNTVVRSGFPNDYALAIADSASQTSTSQMLYVQIPTAFRAQWGLQLQPVADGQADRRDRRAVGVLLPPGMTSTSAFALAGGGTDRAAADRRHEPVGLHLLRARDRQDRHRAASTSLHDIIDDNTHCRTTRCGPR